MLLRVGFIAVAVVCVLVKNPLVSFSWCGASVKFHVMDCSNVGKTIILVHSIMFYLVGIPSGSAEVVELKDEVVLYSLQPLDSDTFIRHPSNSGQVVLTEGNRNMK